MSAEDSSLLLNQLEHILESDPLIDEVGYIHPSQFAGLSAEPTNLWIKTEYDDKVFWIRDHKLAISTDALISLYKEAKCAFIAAYIMLKNCSPSNDTSSNSVTESQVMKHSKALLILSSDFNTAWNSRKQVVSKKQEVPILTDELRLSALVLSYSPKSEYAWSHRRWVIKMIAGKCSNMQEVLEKESQLVKYLAEKSKMNYRAWYHRSWLVSYMSREQVLNEINKNRDWDGLHVADNSCFHYRTRLMLKILEDPIPSSDDELRQLWKEELDWDEILLCRYTGREALWLHRRFLSLYWIKNFSIDIGLFVDKEVKLFLATSTYHDFSFEDQCAQAVCSATYILWLIKHTSKSIEVEFEKKLGTGVVEGVLKKVCPEKNFIWDSLLHLCDDMRKKHIRR